MNTRKNTRQTEMVQVTDELAVSRRLYGVLERLADWLGEDVENMLYDAFDGLRRMAHDEFTESLLTEEEREDMQRRAREAVARVPAK